MRLQHQVKTTSGFIMDIVNILSHGNLSFVIHFTFILKRSISSLMCAVC